MRLVSWSFSNPYVRLGKMWQDSTCTRNGKGLDTFLGLLPHHVRIQATDLKFLSPMCRKRLFITHPLNERPEVAPHVDLKPRHWIETGCGFLPRHFLETNAPSEEQPTKFSSSELLPPSERATKESQMGRKSCFVDWQDLFFLLWLPVTGTSANYL